MESPLDRDRLVKLLARLDSDSDAEVLAAARMAVRQVREAGLDWDAVVTPHGGRGLKSWLDGWHLYATETRRTAAAERAAEQWQALARHFEEQATAQPPAPSAASAPAAPARKPANDGGWTGHDMIDRLLASPRLDAHARARVEAIASWFRRTHELTGAEIADLESFARMISIRTA